jgi:hypothetical protein
MNCPNTPKCGSYNFFHTENIFFVISGIQTNHLHHFLTVFYHIIGYATLHVHNPKRFGADLRKLNNLLIGLGIICPNKRSCNEVVPGQTADARGGLKISPQVKPVILAASSFRQMKFDSDTYRARPD